MRTFFKTVLQSTCIEQKLFESFLDLFRSSVSTGFLFRFVSKIISQSVKWILTYILQLFGRCFGSPASDVVEIPRRQRYRAGVWTKTGWATRTRIRNRRVFHRGHGPALENEISPWAKIGEFLRLPAAHRCERARGCNQRASCRGFSGSVLSLLSYHWIMNFKTLCNASFSLERERKNIVDARSRLRNCSSKLILNEFELYA